MASILVETYHARGSRRLCSDSTSGVQQWVAAKPRDLALKTSPSGGARHSIETYVVIRDVAGASPRDLSLRARSPCAGEDSRTGVVEANARVPPQQRLLRRASAMVFFTSIFERILWRYPYSRAYRAALVEAGHLCQTFCLTATWLGLAPYCVMGLADSLIEHDLGIDGIRESVLYCCRRRPTASRLRLGSASARNPEGPPEQPAVEIATRFQFSQLSQRP